MLHSRRKRVAALVEREAKGESFWSETFDEHLRTQIFHVIESAEAGTREVSAVAQKFILYDEGLLQLVNARYDRGHDFLSYLVSCPDDMMPTVIEAWARALATFEKRGSSQYWSASESFTGLVNDLLREHRVAFELINGEMIPFSSKELHVAVVEPTLRLLSSDSKWSPVEAAYSSALREISAGQAADAITDSGTALQEALTLLGCKGNSLGSLISSALNKGILGAHDGPLLNSIQKTADWVSADRSTKGDAHNATPVELDDAWLIVHVVGAFLLRISKAKPRG